MVKSSQNTSFSLNGQIINAASAATGLHLVATPVGNLGDITLRALSVLAACDYIYCEDTRISRRLMQHFNISTPLKIYHDHNGAKIRPVIIQDIEKGKAIALISDAGTPLVSDPGFKLVHELRLQNLPVHMAPGVSAPIIALALSGLPSDKFQFCGFLPQKTTARQQALQQACDYAGTSIFFESARRIITSLEILDILQTDCQVAVARELTKKFEEVVSGTVGEVLGELKTRQAIKGEITLVMRPPALADIPVDAETTDKALKSALQNQSAAKAALQVAHELGLKKRDLYPRAVALSKKTSGNGE